MWLLISSLFNKWINRYWMSSWSDSPPISSPETQSKVSISPSIRKSLTLAISASCLLQQRWSPMAWHAPLWSTRAWNAVLQQSAYLLDDMLHVHGMARDFTSKVEPHTILILFVYQRQALLCCHSWAEWLQMLLSVLHHWGICKRCQWRSYAPSSDLQQASDNHEAVLCLDPPESLAGQHELTYLPAAELGANLPAIPASLAIASVMFSPCL